MGDDMQVRAVGRVLAGAVAAIALGVGGGAVAGGGPGCGPPPVDAPVVDPFRAPACSWCPGNRGIEYGTAVDTPVRAPWGGQVSFAGAIAGVRWVVVRDPTGWSASYGRLERVAVRVGDAVLAGQVVGWSGAGAYLGLRDPAGTYVDPAPWLGRWVRRPRLVPTTGGGRRPGGPPRLACGNVRASG